MDLINELPKQLFIRIASFLNVNDLFTRLRACCAQFKKIIEDHQLILIQHKKEAAELSDWTSSEEEDFNDKKKIIMV